MFGTKTNALKLQKIHSVLLQLINKYVICNLTKIQTSCHKLIIVIYFHVMYSLFKNCVYQSTVFCVFSINLSFCCTCRLSLIYSLVFTLCQYARCRYFDSKIKLMMCTATVMLNSLFIESWTNRIRALIVYIGSPSE